jgi:tripartite-type tricarboxylate transporter receptor subunit TctC
MCITRPLRAQAMPRNITIICPFAPGGPTDLISRLMAESMGPFLDAQMVVENVTGAGGTIGAARVANARPDGAVLLMHHIGHAGAASLYRRLPYNVEDSFATIGLVTEVPQMIVARPDFPANTVAELLAALRAGGERISIGNSGLGSSDHLAGMLLQREAATTLNTIGFRGSAPIATVARRASHTPSAARPPTCRGSFRSALMPRARTRPPRRRRRSAPRRGRHLRWRRHEGGSSRGEPGS